MGLGKPQLYTKFEVASFGRCRYIKGKSLYSGELPRPGPSPRFLLGGILRWAWVNRSFSHCVNIEKESPDFGELPLPRATPTFSGCNFMISHSKPQVQAKFEVASFSHYRNIQRDSQMFGSSRSLELRPLFLLGVI